MILMMYGATFISRATKSDTLTNITDAHQSTKYSDFILLKDVVLKENFDSFKPLTTFNEHTELCKPKSWLQRMK